MKAKNKNSVVEYDEVKVKSSDYTIDFRKSENADGLHVTGTVRKDGKDAGFINYKGSEGRLSISLTNINTEALDTVKQILSTTSDCLKEIIV